MYSAKWKLCLSTDYMLVIHVKEHLSSELLILRFASESLQYGAQTRGTQTKQPLDNEINDLFDC